MLLQLSISAALFADPFTGGSGNEEAVPQASRAPVVMLPDGFNIFQLEIREKSADLLNNLRDNRSPFAVGMFLLVIFFYGILHGAGPGHRKTVVFTLFLARPAKKWEPLAAGFLSAGLHAGTSLLLFIFFYMVWESVSTFSASENIAFYLEGWTFIILAAFAVILVAAKIIALVTGAGHKPGSVDGRNIYYLLIISSLFPCPGATMLLILALSQNLISMGIFGVLSMSLGMGIIISLAGYIGMTGRKSFFMWFKDREGMVGKLSNIFELLSYFMIALFSLWMGSPFIFWLSREILEIL
ncbi:MAG: hypothetical protein KAR21_22050 [Spirochaetales bacterium]|nr:hypothetical protein [Spirochaetales bacterium]